MIADTGEDAIVYCPDSDYAANIELAEAVAADASRARAPTQPLAKTPTPGKSTCEDVAALLGLPLARTVKSLVLATDAARTPPATSRDRRSGCCWCAATTR